MIPRIKTTLCALAACLSLEGAASAQLMHGYLGVPNDGPEKAEDFGAGFSMYVAAWPLLGEWPGQQFQTGLFGTWMFAAKPEREIEGKAYSDIEGGLGWWRDTRFATATPKFIMGGVTLNFATWANGPGAGKGRDWDEPRGKYGVAQLSPWVVWPPDGLNLAQGTCGELFGYGYAPLPLTEPKATTAGQPVPTGNQCWTLFLSTENFRGPVAFFTPYFFSQHTVDRPDLAGIFLDAMPSAPGRALQMETQYIPAEIATDTRGRTFAQAAPTRFPMNGDDASVLVHRITSYGRGALWDGVRGWFDGGEAPSGAFDMAAGHVHGIPGKGWSTWKIHGRGVPDEEEHRLHWSSFAEPTAIDEHTFGYLWSEEAVRRAKGRKEPLFTLPETFELTPKSDEEGAPLRWEVIERRRIPSATRRKLAEVPLRPREPRAPEPYVTPEDGCWADPGPSSKPIEVTLGDGSVVTYRWYRFADQPALQNADLTAAEREELQRRAELIHGAWTRDREYIPPPAMGTRASLDPALLVEPPKGMEVGYVPICVRQASGTDR